MQFSIRAEKPYLRSAKTEQAAVHVRESQRNGAMEIAKPRQLAGATAESKMTNGDSMMQLTVPHSASTIKYFASPRRSLFVVKTRFYTHFGVHRKNAQRHFTLHHQSFRHRHRAAKSEALSGVICRPCRVFRRLELWRASQ